VQRVEGSVVVRQLFPLPGGEVDALSLYGNDDRNAPPDRPYVIVNMVTSIDGATAVDGVTKALGSPTDRAVFLHLRDVADAILVGASTVRAERYGPARPTAAARAARRARGQSASPPIVAVSRSIDFDWETPFFTDADPRPILLVPAGADPAKLERAGRAADILTSGDEAVDLVEALARLRQRGVNVLLCEGGPTLNTELLSAGLIDELCLTVAPMLIGGPSPRGVFASSPLAKVVSLPLAHLLEDDSFLYFRYRAIAGSGPRPQR
jgi:riboflavin-specific deaminase-like protein